MRKPRAKRAPRGPRVRKSPIVRTIVQNIEIEWPARNADTVKVARKYPGQAASVTMTTEYVPEKNHKPLCPFVTVRRNYVQFDRQDGLISHKLRVSAWINEKP